WARRAPRDEFTAVLYEVEGKDESASVTLTTLRGPQAADLASNIKRWRGQVKLPDAPAAELVKSAVPLKVAGINSHYVDLANPKESAKRILAVMVPLGQDTWFI